MPTYKDTNAQRDAIYDEIVLGRDFDSENVDDFRHLYFDYARQQFFDGADHAHVDRKRQYEPRFCGADLVTCQGEDSPAAVAARRWTVNVCETCYMQHNGTLEDLDEGYTWTPLSLLDSYDMHDGCTECPPCEGCRPEDDGPKPYCACEWGHHGRGHGFSKAPCEGCGSPWAGNRYPLVIEPKRK